MELTLMRFAILNEPAGVGTPFEFQSLKVLLANITLDRLAELPDQMVIRLVLGLFNPTVWSDRIL